jgi:hypothetical protein
MSDDGIYNMLQHVQVHVYVLVLDGSEYNYYDQM